MSEMNSMMAKQGCDMEEQDKRHDMQPVNLSLWLQTVVHIVSNLKSPTLGARFTRFGQADHTDPLDDGAASHKSG